MAKIGSGNSLVSPCLKRRIRRRVIRDYQIGEYQNSPCSFNVAPTRSEPYTILEVDDYGMKRAEFINLIFWENEKGMQP